MSVRYDVNVNELSFLCKKECKYIEINTHTPNFFNQLVFSNVIFYLHISRSLNKTAGTGLMKMNDG